MEFSGVELCPPEAVPRYTLYPLIPEVVLSDQDSITSCVPAPESAAACGLPLALSATVSEAVRLPVAAGVNNIAMVQVPPAATDAPQVLIWLKSLALAPVKAMLVMLKAAVPVLVRVTT
jgi:hypothetical protein